MFLIVSDSGCDIFRLEGAAFHTAPLTISTDKDHFLDDENLDVKAMVDTLLSYKGRSFTACPSTEQWLSAFDLEDGNVADEIYVVTLTSGLSGTYNSACLARDIYLEKHPETKIQVLDSLSVGAEVRVLLEKIVELKAAGLGFEEVSETMEAYCKKTRLFFAFKSLHNLAQNGRVSKIVAAMAGMLGISLIGTASEAGEVQAITKARGDKNVIATLLKEMKTAGYCGGKVRIAHVENEELVLKISEAIKAEFPEADIAYAPTRGLCAYYCERGGITIGCEM